MHVGFSCVCVCFCAYLYVSVYVCVCFFCECVGVCVCVCVSVVCVVARAVVWMALASPSAPWLPASMAEVEEEVGDENERESDGRESESPVNPRTPPLL